MLPALVRYTLFEDHMYWIDEKEIYKANKFTGKNVTVLVKKTLFRPRICIFTIHRDSPKVREVKIAFKALLKQL